MRSSRSLSEIIADLIRGRIPPDAASKIVPSERTGLPVVRVGRVVTTDDVRSLEDE
jgi:hypothetical protein